MTHPILQFLASLIILLGAALSPPAQAQTKPASPGISAQPISGQPNGPSKPAPALAPPNDPNNAKSAAGKPNAAPTASSEPDRVVAIVNGSKVKLSDIERVLRRSGRTLEGEEFTAEKRDRILYDLITDVLIEQYLRENNAFNNTDLQDSIANSKLYAQSEYMFNYVGRQQVLVEEKDIERFVAEHPDFLQGRRAWEIIDIAIDKHPDIDVNKLQAFVQLINKKDKGQKTDQQADKKGQTAEDILGSLINYVTGKKVNYLDFRGIRHTEEIEPTTYEKLKALKPGEAVLVNAPGETVYHVVKLTFSTPNPTDVNRARGGIIRGLYMERAAIKVRDLLAQMRENVDIKIIDNLDSRAVEKKQAINAARENIGQKVDKEYEQKQLLIKQMKEMADKKVIAESVRRKTKITAASKELREEVSSKPQEQSGNQWLRFASNIWILALPVLFAGAFYHFLRQTEDKLTALINESASVQLNTFERSVQRFLLGPLASWGIGILLFWFLAQSSWNKFFTINYAYMTKQLLEWAGISLGASLACIWLIAKTYRFLPQFLRNWRFLFLGLIAIIQIAMLNAA